MRDFSEKSKENAQNRTIYSFLNNSTMSDTINIDSTRQKQFNEQFTENTNSRIEVQDILSSEAKAENSYAEDSICAMKNSFEDNEINDEFIMNNTLEFLIDFFKVNKKKFKNCFENLNIDENKEKFEKLANIAILSGIDIKTLTDELKTKRSNRRFIATYVFLMIQLFDYKKGNEIDLNSILKRCKDANSTIRKIVVQEIVSFYKDNESPVLDQLFNSLYDPKDNIKLIAFQNIASIIDIHGSKPEIIVKLLFLSTKHTSSQIRCVISNFLFSFYEKAKSFEKQLQVLKECSFSNVNSIIRKLTKQEGSMFAAFHLMLHKCTIDVFRSFKLNRKEMADYADFLVESFKKSEKCCNQENCHLKILNALKFSHLEKILLLIEILKDNKHNIHLLIDTLNKIDRKILVESEYTIPIVNKISNDSDNYVESFFELLLKLEKDLEQFVQQVVSRIKHPKLIGYFNTEPLDNTGVLCQGIWHIKEEKYQKNEDIRFFENQSDNFEDFTEIILFLEAQMRNPNSIQNDNQNFQDIHNAMKKLLDMAIDYLTKKMDQFKKTQPFFNSFTQLLLKGYFTSHSDLLFKSPSHLKEFIKKSNDMTHLTELGLEYLISCKNKKNHKEIIHAINSRYKNKPSSILFRKLRDYMSRDIKMHNLYPFIDTISLDERIILENEAKGEFKERLKSKCMQECEIKKSFNK